MSSPTQLTPSLFIGSSTEGIEVARAIEVNLQKDAEITVWSSGIFGLNIGYLESLVSALDKFDFAVLVLTFELGLFMGGLAAIGPLPFAATPLK